MYCKLSIWCEFIVCLNLFYLTSDQKKDHLNRWSFFDDTGLRPVSKLPSLLKQCQHGL